MPQDHALEDIVPPSLPMQNLNTGLAMPSAKHGKARMYLRNPMSLLQRRRPSQKIPDTIDDRYADYAKSEVPDFDPRIRGKIVHDFNAPRPRTTQSQAEATRLQPHNEQQFTSAIQGNQAQEVKKDESLERQRTPVFKENFDEVKPWNAREQDPLRPPKSMTLYQLSIQTEPSKPDRATLPPFARQVPSSSVDTSTHTKAAAPLHSNNQLEPVHEVALSTTLPSGRPDPDRPAPVPKTRSRTSTKTDDNVQASSIPKHTQSTSSRFSFDLGGVGSSAQEKLLEEKHREHERQKEHIREDTEPQDGDEDENEEYHVVDDDDDDDDDGLEERIPGVNADDDDDGLEQPVTGMKTSDDIGSTEQATDASQPLVVSQGPGLTVSTRTTDSFRFASPERSSFVSPASVASTEYTLPDTPRDDQGNIIGLAYSKSSPNLVLPLFHGTKPNGKPLATMPAAQPSLYSPEAPNGHMANQSFRAQESAKVLPDDDFGDKDYYCDDDLMGEIAAVNEGETFDESLLDDETGRYRLPNRYWNEDQTDNTNGQGLPSAAVDNGSLASKREAAQMERDTKTVAVNIIHDHDDVAAEMHDNLPSLRAQPKSSIHQISLTKDNLEAYHDALALAANQAESKGRFRRSSIQSESSDIVGNLPLNGSPTFNQEAVGNDFDYDDALADDSIIAEANAEALENDDEGFYGHEFGFYARGNSKAEYANGGYFGPQAAGASVYRSCSGKVNFQEPNLTPITERSELASNRNSAISLVPLYGYSSSGVPLSSPGLAQLAAMSSKEDDSSLTYSAYLKSKRMAFGGGGGNNISPYSSSGNSGSPNNHLPPQGLLGNQSNPNVVNISPQNMASSLHSFSSSMGSDSSPASDASPTITLPSKRFAHVPPTTSGSNMATFSTTGPLSVTGAVPAHTNPHSSAPACNPPPVVAVSSRPASSSLAPLTNENKHGKASSHSRNSSVGTESVSYMQERDESGRRASGKWIVEKRRLGADGVEHILGREVVEAGAI